MSSRRRPRLRLERPATGARTTGRVPAEGPEVGARGKGKHAREDDVVTGANLEVVVEVDAPPEHVWDLITAGAPSANGLRGAP